MRHVWIAIALQFCGYVFDAVWHGVFHPGVEPRTFDEMAGHLVTVHLPLYVGAASLLLTTVAALRRRHAGWLRVAVAGAALSVAAEAWHAVSHLRLDTHTAPIAGIASVVGFAVAVGAVTLGGWRRSAAADDARKRAA